MYTEMCLVLSIITLLSCVGDQGHGSLTADQVIDRAIRKDHSLLGSEFLDERNEALLILNGILRAGGYRHSNNEDSRNLLDVMTNRDIDTCSRLCIAYFLLQMDDDEAKSFVRDSLFSGDEMTMHHAASVLEKHVEHNGSRAWGIDLMIEFLSRDRLYEIKPDRIWKNGKWFEGANWGEIGREKRAYASDISGSFCNILANLKVMRAIPSIRDTVMRHPDLDRGTFSLRQLLQDRTDDKYNTEGTKGPR